MIRALLCVIALVFLLGESPAPSPTLSPTAPAATVSPAPTATASDVRHALEDDLRAYVAKRASIEHISNASLAVSLRSGEQMAIVTGTVSTDPQSAPVTPMTLYQIGSNTKAFTSAAILQLEAEGRLSLNDTLGKWLPQYHVWKDVNIRQLLNMTSGIPTYDAEPTLMRAYARHPDRYYSAQLLVDAVYPQYHKPRPGHAWAYSNTNYVLAQMIIERATHDTYANQLRKRFFVPLGLNDTYYATHTYPPAVSRRLSSGYFANNQGKENEPLTPILGRDVRDFSLSWTQGAGGIVSRPLQVARWVRALYQSTMLKPKQRAELLTIVSNRTGNPIKRTSVSDPRGFGLGVGQLTTPVTGTLWYYEGETLGYRVLYGYFPKQDAVIVLALNSQPPGNQDQIGKLMDSVFLTLTRYKML